MKTETGVAVEREEKNGSGKVRDGRPVGVKFPKQSVIGSLVIDWLQSHQVTPLMTESSRRLETEMLNFQCRLVVQ